MADGRHPPRGAANPPLNGPLLKDPLLMQFTLRQIEIIRAIMVSGTVAGAARLLSVSAPGISRAMKHIEDTLDTRLFVREGGRFVPSPEARDVFAQINAVYKKIEDLHGAVENLNRGQDNELRIGSVPSIANVMVPRAARVVRRRYPRLLMNIDVLKIEEAFDFLLLNKGELMAMSYRLEHPAIHFEPLARGKLVCIVPESHPLAAQTRVSVAEIVRYPLIGINPNDPYGRIMANLFAQHGLEYEISIQARFGTTVCALVRQELGIAVIDAFTLADGAQPGLRVLQICEPTIFETYVAYRNDTSLSDYGRSFIKALRAEMHHLTQTLGVLP